MKDYRPQVPRAAFATGAVALAFVTLGALVVAPAKFDSGFADTLAARKAAGPMEVAISPARIDVVGVRVPDVAWAMPDDGKPNCKPSV